MPTRNLRSVEKRHSEDLGRQEHGRGRHLCISTFYSPVEAPRRGASSLSRKGL